VSALLDSLTSVGLTQVEAANKIAQWTVEAASLPPQLQEAGVNLRGYAYLLEYHGADIPDIKIGPLSVKGKKKPVELWRLMLGQAQATLGVSGNGYFPTGTVFLSHTW
jgi:hypothetical protein